MIEYIDTKDERGNVIKRVSADGTETYYATYDERNNETSFTDNDGDTHYATYDEHNNRTSYTGPRGTHYWTYDENSNIATFTNYSGVVTHY